MVTRYDLHVCGYPETSETDGDWVKYQDYAALETRLLTLLDHPAMNAFAEALAASQTTGLAFIRVNANGHVQVLPSDRVQLSVIQAVEEQEARARIDQAAAYWKSQDPAKLEAMCDAALAEECDHIWFTHPATYATHCILCREGLTGERKTK